MGTRIEIWIFCDADRRAKDAEQFNRWPYTLEEFDHMYKEFVSDGQPAYPEPQPTNCWACGTELEQPGGLYTLAACPKCCPETLETLKREVRKK